MIAQAGATFRTLGTMPGNKYSNNTLNALRKELEIQSNTHM